MLEQIFKDPAATQRWRSGLLGPHLDSFVEVVSDLGYSKASTQVQLWLLGTLQEWLERNRLGIADLEEPLLQRFLDECRRKGSLRRGEPRTLRRFLCHLREQRVVRAKEPTIDRSPLATLKRRYEGYLGRERGLAPATVARYWPFLKRFLFERFGDGPIQLHELTPRDVASFLLRHARSSTPGMARLTATALRSFLRFLFQHGEARSNLAGAIPTVPAWRLADVPKFLKPDEVQRIVDVCDQRTPVGRRNRAVVLLLARLGLRASEVITLDLEDIDWRAAVLTVRGKGRYHDRLPLPTEVGEALAAYLRQDRPLCATRRVFILSRAPHRGFAHPSTVSTIVCRAVRRAGLKPAMKGAHLLRHSLATGMLRCGASMAEIGEVLRHRLPNTTEIYAKVDIDGLRSLARPWPTAGGER
jgi:site-specific recombinase XerD